MRTARCCRRFLRDGLNWLARISAVIRRSAAPVNGQAVKSCTMFAIEADGAEVSTIEGQANADGSLNVIQQAFQDHHGLQCGFCTSGMVMSTVSLLKENPKPTEAALTADFSAGAIAGLSVDADNLIADLHGSPEYRAHLVKVMTGRAVAAA